MFEYVRSVAEGLNTIEAIGAWCSAIIGTLFTVLYFYQFFYIFVALIHRPLRYKKTDQSKHYAVVIAARNEENVLPALLKTVAGQTYPKEKLTVFVVVDNCTDRTADVARAEGAVVYERQNKEFVGKGYALDFLLQNIGADYPEGFDGYFVFDADNLLAPDYTERMNEMFSNGHQIVTSYRNSKNFGGNWISAGYALWFLRESRYLNGARNRLGSSAAVGGTGFLFSQRVLDESHGWRFYLLTEDIEFSVYHILRGEKIAICEDAVLYDEQPTGFRQSVRQRLRWAKGYLQVFRRYGADLLKGAAKGSWSCFDMSMSILPAFILTALCLLANITLSVLGLMQGVGVWFAMRSLLECMGSILATLLVLGGITVASEWKRIHAPAWKKIAYTLTFPLFMLTYLPISMAALFMKVEWKPIHHSVNLSSLPYPAAKN